MMEIVQIDPLKKYVLLMPGATQAEAARVTESLRSFIDDEVQVVFVIYGMSVAIVPTDQVVGYKAVEDD